MKKVLSLLLMSICSYINFGQVGIGETQPTAMLEIKTQNDGFAALALSPQANPRGEYTGQLSIIDGNLYMYDENRRKWLSIESNNLEFGRLGQGSEPLEIEFGGSDMQTGAKLPFDGTLTSISFKASDAVGNRNIIIFINNVPVPNDDLNTNADGIFDLNPTQLKFVNNNYNLDFNEGDILNFQVDENVGANDIEELILVATIKWRQDNN